MTNLLENGGFEDGWWRKTHTGQTFNEIVAPKHWIAFWREGGPVPHDPNNEAGYARPESRVISKVPPYLDPPRIHQGNQAWQAFTFFRIHDAGIYQVVEGITPGMRLKASAWTHAWSSQDDDPHNSTLEGGGKWNFTQRVGIDPNGGTDPWSDDVIWSNARNVYDDYEQLPALDVVAEGDAVTVFLRSEVMYPFKHCDVYWDDAELVVVGEAEEPTEPEPSEPSEPTPPVEPGTQVNVGVLPTTPVEKEVFQIVAKQAAELGDLRLAFSGGDVLRGDPKVRAGDVAWRAVALNNGAYTVEVRAGSTVVGSAEFHVRERGEQIR